MSSGLYHNVDMKKEKFEITKGQAIEILGLNHKKEITASEAAKKMEISRQALDQWEDILSPGNKDKVISAIFRWNLRRRMNKVIAENN